MIVGSASQGPEKLPIRFADGQIVDAGKATGHKAIRVEFPVLVSVRPVPVAAVVVPFVGETDGNPVFVKGPQFLDQSVVQLALPLPCQELDDLCATAWEFRSIAPYAIDRVSKRDLLGIATIPAILSQPSLQLGGFQRKWRQRRASYWSTHADQSCINYASRLMSGIRRSDVFIPETLGALDGKRIIP